MKTYAILRDGGPEEADEELERIKTHLRSPAAPRMEHSELERRLQEHGWSLLRSLLFQGHLDLRAREVGARAE